MTFCGRILLSWIFFLWGTGPFLNAQAAQLDFRQYSTDNGLPSSETYTILEDQSGYIWIGTDNGVARFDGYEFTVFDADDGLEDMVVFGLEEDNNGRIWISTYSGKVYYFEDGRFHAFAHNNVIKQSKINRYITKIIDITDESNLVFSIQHHGFFQISLSGKFKWLAKHKPGNSYAYGAIKHGKLPSFPRPQSYVHTFQSETSLYRPELSFITSHTVRKFAKINFNRLGFRGGYLTAVFDNNGHRETVVSSPHEVFILNEAGNIKHEYQISSKSYHYYAPGLYSDTYWAFLARGGGLEHHDFRHGRSTPKITNHLRGRSLSSGIIDSKGGLWVTTLEAGIFYCPFPKQQVYTKGDSGKNDRAVSILATAPGNFYAGYGDGTVFQYKDDLPDLRIIHEEMLTSKERIHDMFYDSLSSRVLTPTFTFTHPLKDHEVLKFETVQKYHHKNGNRILPRSFNQEKTGHTRKVFIVHGSFTGEIDLESVDNTQNISHSTKSNTNRPFVYGRHPNAMKLVGTLNGLMELKEDGTIVPNNLGIPELSNRVVFIQDLGNKDVLFGTRGDGIVYLNADTSYVIREADGLASYMVRDIHLSHNGTVWVSSLNGLTKLNILNGGKEYKLRTFRKEQGLPTNEVYQTDTYQDDVWLATSSGVVKFEETPIVTHSTSPVIRSFFLNGEEIADTSNYNLPPGSQDVSISFSTINFILANKVPYRYRINEASVWKYSQERTANYPNLGPGTYRFEVQSQNQDGFWSDSTIRHISVATPWYATIWAIIVGAFLLTIALSSFFLLRERRRKREQDLLVQITKLEHAALHAQMNPHFIFNALNSIQNFVLQNSPKQAAVYLARFAQVIRQTLRSSVDGHHYLKDELQMLETYLSLEKLRFKEGFFYSIVTDPSLPKDDILLPPLLIQPFVENAILHGLKGTKEGGKISVSFSGSPENIIVTIEDNGIGYIPGSSDKPDSLGMGITRRRLGLMDLGKGKTSGMEVKPLIDDSGNLCGTRVTLQIPPLLIEKGSMLE